MALSDSLDSAHEALAITSERPSSHIVTTDEVLGEYLTFFATAPAQIRREVTASVLDILASKAIHVLPQSRESFLAGLSLHSSRPDKGYSLIDCISMQVMRREKLTEVLTNDHHFEQEGFHALFGTL